MVPEKQIGLKCEGLPERMQRLQEWLVEAARAAKPAHEVERHLFREVLQLGKCLFESFLQLVGPGDVGESVTLPDGHSVHRLEKLQPRRYVSVFGEFQLRRYVYAVREGQKIEYVPLDQGLQLPASAFSYVLQEWDQLLAMEQAYGRVVETMRVVIGIEQCVDSLERMNLHMAEAAEPFRAAQAPPDPATEGELLVATVDNKGVPMVRRVEQAPVGAHRKKGEKANKKQHATLGCVYSVDQHARTAEDLVAILFRDPERPKQTPPEAQHKRYGVSMTHRDGPTEVRGQDELFEHLQQEVQQRRRVGQTLIYLTDGQRSLETDRQKHLPQDAHTVDVLELMHVIPRLWDAAHLFEAEGSEAAAQFVRERLRKVLQGKAKRVIAGLREMGTKRGLRGGKKQRLEKLCAFLQRNLDRMKYHEYLAKGYPIASGVIEGACRHVIKDRMERSGMRWKVPGAYAMLQLRAVYANGDWNAFQTFRIEHETARLYPHRLALHGAPGSLAA